MAMSFDAAVALLMGADGPFATEEVTIRGQTYDVFRRTPTSLRALFDGARGRGDDVFLVYENERWSFAEVMRHADALAALLVRHYGVRPGDRVAIGMRNYPEWIVAFAAITSIGAVAVSLNAWWSADELVYGLRDSGSTAIVADRERLERLLPRRAEVDTRLLSVRWPEAPAGVDRYEALRRLGEPIPEVEIEADADATILYTSGTTGHPKGAVSTHRAVLTALMAYACRAAVRNAMDPDERGKHPFPPVFILAVPLFHVTGLIPVMLSAFAGGNKLVMMYKWNAERALELIERERVTIFVGVPTMSWDLLESPDFARRDTSSLLNVGGGGAPAPPELVRRVAKSFRTGRPSIGYGMTETNAYGPQNAGDDYLRKPTSAGRVLPVVRMRVTDLDGNTLGANETGEIWFRGANLIRGYWNKPEATAETIVDGWLRSGDIGRIDEEGFVFVSDRAKDMVLRAGENIYCAEVEAVLYEHPAVYEAVAFGVPHPRLGEELAVAVYPRPGASIDPDALRAHVAAHLAAFKVPTYVEIFDQQLPRNASGKILKRAIRDAMVARQLDQTQSGDSQP